ncbi:carboxypeptidase-like regulatory domain-containing protein [Halococcus dombrowskii]|uniref:Carboxypeptidase-like regulatory domain-containing protein n=1 Tax=Halococcus dombrowskii TaxID=179637 RepID=A0AAX3ALM9_HALDO|nr:carboxypeptidase-like regulatory domain-containing protein [Halococcus dombrowskii]UOO95137.1 carboxypeptidase-like regulatory domain-containing protein [Halococcus dombrowskii]
MVSAPRFGTVVVVCLAALLVTVGLVPAGVAPADASMTDRSLQAAQPTNNSSVVHEDPQSADDEGNVSELQGSLSDRLGETLVDCSEGLEVGNYNACNESKDYPDWLGKYVNVTRSSDAETNKTDEFQEARENQTSYANDVQRFRTTVDKYRTARANGRTERARRLARRAQRLSQQINETGTRLTEDYRTIDNGTTQNFSAAIHTTNATTENVSATADSVSVEQFKNTTITSSTADNRIAFNDSLVVSGRLRTANGTPLANRTVVLEGDDRLRRTTTDESGQYVITYRPAVLPLDTRRLTVRYRPSTQSIYRSNRTAVPIDVRQVTPTLQAETTPQSVGFDELLSVTGRVAVNDSGVGSVPVAVSIDGREFNLSDGSRVRTGSAGRFRMANGLPADVAPGRQRVRVSMPLENRSIARTNTTVPVTVTQTPTQLSLNATQESVNGSAVGGPIVHVEGQLSANGTPVANRTVAVGLNNSTTPVTTDENGSYDANVTVSEGIFADRTGTTTATIGATFEGGETNLESSRRRTSIELTVPAEATGVIAQFVAAFRALPISYQLLLGLGLVFVLGALLSVLRRWLGITESDTEDAPSSTLASESTDTVDDPREGLRALLRAAREELSAGDADGAVGFAYTAVRRAFGRDPELGGARTHWEFLDACIDRGLGDRQLGALRRLTERYERATFSQRSVSTDTASSALEDAQTMTDPDEQAPAENSDSDVDTNR